MKVMRFIGDEFSHWLNANVKPLAKHYDLARSYAPRMDVFTIRHANLQLLVQQIRDRHIGRRQKDVAADLDMSASFLSQLLSGKRLGDDVARKIESTCKLTHGWMDLPHQGNRVGESSALYSVSQSVRIDPDTIAAALQLVRLSFLNLGLEIDQEENGEPLAAAYEFLMARKEHAVTASNLLEFKPRIVKLMGEGNEPMEQEGNRTSRAIAG